MSAAVRQSPIPINGIMLQCADDTTFIVGGIMSKSILLLLTGDFMSLEPALQEQVYKEFFRFVYPMVVYIVKEHPAAEDIIHDAFLGIIRRGPHSIEENKLNAWVSAVARNATISYLRKNKRRRDELLSDDVYMDEAVPLMKGYLPSTEDEVVSKLFKEAIIEIIDHIKPIYRQVILMRWLEQLSYKEIAERLDVTEDKIRQVLYRAREMVKRKLQEDWKVESHEKSRK